jgi:hypothetical protein
MQASSASTSIGNTSNYQITSSGTSPTFTENFDDTYSGDERSFSSAYAIYGDSKPITAFGYDYSVASVSTQGGGLIVIRAQSDAAADIAHLDLTPTIKSVEGSNTANADITHLAIEPTVESVTGKSTSDLTQWTNEDDVNTTWSNET